MDEQGLQTARLGGLDVGAVLLSPAHSYPSGVVLSADRRVELLGWARAAGTLVIEDDYDAELRYDRMPIGAVQGLDPERVSEALGQLTLARFIDSGAFAPGCASSFPS